MSRAIVNPGFPCLVLILFLTSGCQAWTSRGHQGVQMGHQKATRHLPLSPCSSRRSTSSPSAQLTLMDDASADTVPIILGTALVLGIAAQTFINQMIQGDQGLGAFLRDGSGYNRSGFRASSRRDETKSDPLPWLKLPQLDFVEVVGQEPATKLKNEKELFQQLETMRQQLNAAKQAGRLNEAKELQQQLERSLEYYGIEFKIDD